MIDFRSFWGKAQPRDDTALSMHPAAWHGLDVAACFAELLAGWPELNAAITSAFVEETDEIVPALLMLVALHDVGKFAPGFQAKAPNVYPACLGQIEAVGPAYHDRIGLALATRKGPLSSLVRTVFAADEVGCSPVLGAVFGHHGKPVQAETLIDVAMGGSRGAAMQAAQNFGAAVHALMGKPCLPPLKDNAEQALSWRLAGAVALADWLGSDQRRFSYRPADLELENYWEIYAKPQASAAVKHSGLLPSAVSPAPMAERLFPPTVQLSEAQLWAAETDLAGKDLFFIEDVMGSGKTEAALILAHRLMQAGRASGLYLALPTMATANAMHGRLSTGGGGVGALYRTLFSAGARPSLVLAHGARDLNRGFADSINLADEAAEEECYGYGEDGETGSAACARWLADDRRKTFLADVGVGTVDQALLAVLPVKHASVRQAGLGRRVLIIDEAHSYDFYMQRELEELIAHQARLGAPVIILSATLPGSIKKRLAAACARGAGRMSSALVCHAYPLATSIGVTPTETPFAPRADLRRTVAIRRLDTLEAAEALIVEAARRGAAVAYIRNTVDDALESFARLSADGLRVELFHARFAMGDRIPIEDRIVRRFGARGGAEERHGKVLVATQVVEQSIDLDFDLLVTDLAPVDLILQRMGRMWRHKRETRGWPGPEIAVLSPEPVLDAPAGWYGALFPRAQWVYRDHALLWRSASLLFKGQTIRVPEDMRTLMESAYDRGALDEAPEGLQRAGWEAAGKAKADRGHASLNVLRFDEGYMPASGAWGPDTVTPTRLGDERRNLRLCVWENDRLRPWCADPEEKRAWALSEVSVRAERVSGRSGLAPEIESAAAALDARWADRGAPALAMPLFLIGESWRVPIAPSKHVENATYDRDFGLKWKTSL